MLARRLKDRNPVETKSAKVTAQFTPTREQPAIGESPDCQWPDPSFRNRSVTIGIRQPQDDPVTDGTAHVPYPLGWLIPSARKERCFLEPPLGWDW